MNKQIIKAVLEKKIDRKFLKLLSINKPLFFKFLDNEIKCNTPDGIEIFTKSEFVCFTDHISEDSYIYIEIGADE
jgi:hypothetical protein